MEDFLNKKIDGAFFFDHIYGLRWKLIDACEKFNLELISNSEKIKDFQPDRRSKKLIGFLTYLYSEYEYCADTEDFQNKEFYDSIKNGFFDCQKALNEE